jgi:outer membrane protein OmpA-like peptidoglycan-associated protein
MFRSLVLLGLVALASFSASAQTTVYYREGQRVDPQDVKNILENVDESSMGTTRSIRLLNDRAKPDAGGRANVAYSASDSSTANTTSTTSALSLPVQFEFDSAKILPAARSQLDALAAGIKLIQADRSVVIEGHTDARGSDLYNEVLSFRRAAAVKLYLVQFHGIDPQRLKTVGVGSVQPITGTDPMAAENRRVQFRGG